MFSGRHAHTIRKDAPQKKSAVKDIKAPRNALLMFACALKFPGKLNALCFAYTKHNQISIQTAKSSIYPTPSHIYLFEGQPP
jgi:hypothetical protein